MESVCQCLSPKATGNFRDGKVNMALSDRREHERLAVKKGRVEEEKKTKNNKNIPLLQNGETGCPQDGTEVERSRTGGQKKRKSQLADQCSSFLCPHTEMYFLIYWKQY